MAEDRAHTRSVRAKLILHLPLSVLSNSTWLNECFRLAGIESVRIPTMTNLINNLESNAYIVRRVDNKDKRTTNSDYQKGSGLAYSIPQAGFILSGVVATLTKTGAKQFNVLPRFYEINLW